MKKELLKKIEELESKLRDVITDLDMDDVDSRTIEIAREADLKLEEIKEEIQKLP